MTTRAPRVQKDTIYTIPSSAREWIITAAEAWNRARLEQRADLTTAGVEAAYIRTRDEGLHGHLRTD